MEYRLEQQGRDQPPTKTRPVPITPLLHEDFSHLESGRIRAQHLSWDKFLIALSQNVTTPVDLDRDEMGWEDLGYGIPATPQYLTFNNELGFQNAIAMMQLNTSNDDPPCRMRVYFTTTKSLPSQEQPTRSTSVVPTIPTEGDVAVGSGVRSHIDKSDSDEDPISTSPRRRQKPLPDILTIRETSNDPSLDELEPQPSVPSSPALMDTPPRGRMLDFNKILKEYQNDEDDLGSDSQGDDEEDGEYNERIAERDRMLMERELIR